MRFTFRILAATTLVAASTAAPAATTVLLEDFTSASAASKFSQTLVGDGFAIYNYDYASTATIPSAPSTTDSTKRALRLEANRGPVGVKSAINIYTNAVFSGNYRVTVDVYGYDADLAGSTTELYLVGVNASGTKTNNWFQGGGLPADTDGYWFQNHIDGGDQNGFQEGGAAGSVTPGGITWRDGITTQGARDIGDLATSIFPPNGYLVNTWTTWDIIQNNGTTTFRANGALIGTYTDTTFPSGKVLLGHEDSYASLKANNAFLFDNLKVQTFTSGVNDWSIY